MQCVSVVRQWFEDMPEALAFRLRLRITVEPSTGSSDFDSYGRVIPSAHTHLIIAVGTGGGSSESYSHPIGLLDRSSIDSDCELPSQKSTVMSSVMSCDDDE